MINRINLVIPNIKHAYLNKSFFTVPALYIKYLPKFNSQGIKQVNIILNTNNSNLIVKDIQIRGVVEVVKHMDLIHYLNLNNFNKSKFQLDIIHNVMIDLLNLFRVDISLINNTYLTCLNKQILFQEFITKPIVNKLNKKLKLSLFAEADLENLKLFYVVECCNIIIHKNIFLETGSDSIDLIYELSAEWLSETDFIIKQKYKQLITNKYMFSI